MKKALRLLSLFLAGCLTLSFFAACGDAVTTTQAPSTEPTTPDEPEVERDFTELATRAASEGIVLLKNEGNLLPFSAEDTVAMFGKGQVDTVKGGGGSGDVYVFHVVNILEGMDAKVKEGKVKLYENVAKRYRLNQDYKPNSAILQKAAENSTAAVYVISRNSSEGGDRQAKAGDYYLSNQEIDDIENLIAAGFTDIAVLLNVGGMMDTTKLLSYPEIKSIMLVWQPGQYGGYAIADTLVGDSTPSGKLSDTFAKDYMDYPSSATLRESEAYVKYTEDVFVGYRYFETFDPNYEKVNYEFGFGLSYTDFSITDVVTKVEGENMKVTAKVTNTGTTYSGKEVVQVYFSAPQGVLGKPAKELAGFAKTGLLAPGESETVTITFPIDDMSSYDDMGHVQKSAYVMEAGDYRIYVGNSVKNAGERGVAYTYTLTETKITEQLTEQLAANLIEERLKADGSYENIYRDSLLETDKYTTVSATGISKVEAENFADAINDSINPEYISTGDDKGGYSVSGLHFAGSYVTYVLKVEKAGDYRITMRVANGTSNIKYGCYATVNNVRQDAFLGYELPVTSVSGNQWFNFKTLECGVITLKEGMNSLTFTAIDLIANIDWFTLEPISEEELSTAAVYARAEALASENKIMFADLLANPTLMEAFIDQLTLEELVHLLYGHDARVFNATGTIGKLESYEIPGAETCDGPAGIRSIKGLSVAWPVQTMLACTWNTALITEVGDAIAYEGTKIGIDIWLAPGVNIHRNPLCGRNFEYYSEDPLLSGELAAALITGVQAKGIGVAIKHFVGNETELNRNDTDSRMSERALREIYLRPFEIAVKKADPWLVMTSYNKVNGVETAECYDLCTNILRGEWGFKGLVTTDWANNSNQYKEILAGNDIKMHHTDPQVVIDAVDDGLITREQIEVSVQRVLEMIMKTNAATRGWQTFEPIVITATETNRIYASDHHERPDSQAEICEDIGGGINLSSVGDGHYIKYNVKVEKSGTYTVSFRVATPNSNCYIKFYSDDVLVGTISSIASTGGWQKWSTTDEFELQLKEGVHVLKIEFKGNALNPNYFELTYKG